MNTPIEISGEDHDGLRRLEESLWQAQHRFDRAHMENTLAPDFFEFGRSGRVYRTEDTLGVPFEPSEAKLPLPNFAVRMISADVALVTYVSEVKFSDVTETANRSSLWSRYPAGWKLRFHQGTPI
jgi:hypothetical protein